MSGRRLAVPIGALMAALWLTACPSDPDPEPDAAADIDASAPDGDATIPDGDTTAPDADATAPDGDASVPDGDASTPDGDASVPDGDASAPDGDASAPDGDASVPDGDASAPDGDASVPDGDASVPDGDASPPDADASAPDDGGTGPEDTAAGPDADAGAADPLAALSDEFDDAASLTDWTQRWQAEGDPAPYATFDVDSTTNGRMTIDPIAPPARGWFQDDKGPYIYKEVTGDFVAWTHIRVGTPADIDAAPSGEFAAGGFVVRTPGSSSPGNEAWVMHNIGRQAIPAFPTASEVKTTFPGGGGSTSSLFLTDVGGLQGQLAVCRLGSQFYFFHRIDGVDSDWVEEVYDGGNVWLDNNNLGNYVDYFNRTDMPPTVQVGIIANSDFNQVAPPPRVDVDYVRFATPSSYADCTALAQ